MWFKSSFRFFIFIFLGTHGPIVLFVGHFINLKKKKIYFFDKNILVFVYASAVGFLGQLEHPRPKILSYPILPSQKVTLSIIPYNFTILSIS